MRRAVLVLLALAACNEPAAPPPSTAAPPPTLPPLDVASADAALAAIAGVNTDATQRAMIAANALLELEDKRLPGRMLPLFQGYSAPAADRAMTFAGPLGDFLVAPWLARACPDHAAVFQRLRDAPPEAAAARVWTDCRMQDHGLVTLEQATASDPLMLFAAHVPYVYLLAHGGADPREVALLRHLVAPRE